MPDHHRNQSPRLPDANPFTHTNPFGYTIRTGPGCLKPDSGQLPARLRRG